MTYSDLWRNRTPPQDTAEKSSDQGSNVTITDWDRRFWTLEDHFLEWFRSPAQFTDLLNNTLLREKGIPPLHPYDIAPLNCLCDERFPPASLWEGSSVVAGVYRSGQPKTFSNLQAVFSVTCTDRISLEEASYQQSIAAGIYRWQTEILKDREHRTAHAQWEADAAAAREHNAPIPKEPIRREEDTLDDHLVRCIPVVLYAGPGTCTTAARFRQTARRDPYRVLDFSPNYHLIVPGRLPDAIFSHCSTDVGLLLRALKYQGDEARQQQILRDGAYLKLGDSAARFLDIATGMNLYTTIHPEAVYNRMCEGMQKWAAKEHEKGYKEGFHAALQEIRAVMDELEAGTPDEKICKKFDITQDKVDIARKALEMARQNSTSASSS